MKEKLWNKKYVFLIILNALSGFSFYMVTTVLTSYLVNIGSTLSMAGIIVGLFSITSLIIRPITGYVSDNFNKKRILIGGSLIIGIAVGGYITTTSLSLIMLCRIVHGVAFALISTSTVALGSEFIPQSRFGEGIGYLGLGQIIASAIAPGVGTWVMNQYGIRYSFVIAMLFSITGMIFMIFFDYHYSKERSSFSFKLENIISTKALNSTLVGAMFSFGNGVIASFIVLYALTMGIKDVSIYFTVCAIFLFAIRPLTGKLVDKIDIAYIVYPGIALTVFSMILLANAHAMPMIILSAVTRSIGQGAVQPILQTQCIKEAGVEKSGVATSTFYLGGDVGQGIGPIVGGMIAGFFGYGAVFYLCAVLLSIGAIIFYYGRKGRNENERIIH